MAHSTSNADGVTYTRHTNPCPECKEVSHIQMSGQDHWQFVYSGKHAQDALPHWSPADREQLMTGMHPACWDKVFSGPEF